MLFLRPLWLDELILDLDLVLDVIGERAVGAAGLDIVRRRIDVLVHGSELVGGPWILLRIRHHSVDWRLVRVSLIHVLLPLIVLVALWRLVVVDSAGRLSERKVLRHLLDLFLEVAVALLLVWVTLLGQCLINGQMWLLKEVLKI